MRKERKLVVGGTPAKKSSEQLDSSKFSNLPHKHKQTEGNIMSTDANIRTLTAISLSRSNSTVVYKVRDAEGFTMLAIAEKTLKLSKGDKVLILMVGRSGAAHKDWNLTMRVVKAVNETPDTDRPKLIIGKVPQTNIYKRYKGVRTQVIKAQKENAVQAKWDREMNPNTCNCNSK